MTTAKLMTEAQAVVFFREFFKGEDLSSICTHQEVRVLAKRAAEAVTMLKPDVEVERPAMAFRQAIRGQSAWVDAQMEIGNL